MKKSRMLLLFGGLFMMLVSYVAWCGRTFYMRPPMPDLSRLPVEARELARVGIEDSSLFRPELMNMRRFKQLIANPYESEPLPIRVDWSPDTFTIRRSGQPQTLLLTKQPNDWKLWVFPEDLVAFVRQ